jgi:hypothetical protein
MPQQVAAVATTIWGKRKVKLGQDQASQEELLTPRGEDSKGTEDLAWCDSMAIPHSMKEMSKQL